MGSVATPTMRYWIRVGTLDWMEVSRKDYIKAEASAGLSDGKKDVLAAKRFDKPTLKGRVTFGEITPEKYRNDTEFLSAVLKATLLTPTTAPTT